MNDDHVPTIHELSAENDALRAENEALRAENGASNTRWALCAEIESLCALIDVLRAENEALRNDLDAALLEQCGRFTVAAGEYDGHDRSVKYINSFDTLAAAIAAYDEVADYMWRHVEYNGRRLTADGTKY